MIFFDALQLSVGLSSPMRRWICNQRITTVVVLVSLFFGMSGCGFQLRGTGQTASLFETAYLSSEDRNGALARELVATLAQSGVDLTSLSAAQVSIALGRERFTRRPVSTTGQINVAEYELTLEVGFSVMNQAGEELIPPTRIRTERIYTFDSSSLVGSKEEETLINVEMRRDVIGQLIQRVNASIRTVRSAGSSGLKISTKTK